VQLSELGGAIAPIAPPGYAPGCAQAVLELNIFVP